jgi:hypothetical protein
VSIRGALDSQLSTPNFLPTFLIHSFPEFRIGMQTVINTKPKTNETMKRNCSIIRWAALAVFVSTLNSQVSTLFAQPTAFSVQGRLQTNGVPVTGAYDIQYSLFDAAVGGNLAPGTSTNTLTAVGVANGIFNLTPDFGAAPFTGQPRYLQIGFSQYGSGNPFTALTQRQPILAAPYAIFAGTASNVVSGSVVNSLNNQKGNLTIQGNNGVSVSTSGSVITVSGGGGGSGGAQGSFTISGSGPYLTFHDTDCNPCDPQIKSISGELRLKPAGGPNDFLHIANNGNVGIGTTPSKKLDVAGDENLQGSLFFGARGGQHISLWADPYQNYGFGIQSQTLYSRCGSNPGDNFAWYRGGSHRENFYHDAGAGGQVLMTLDAEHGLTINGGLAINGGNGIALSAGEHPLISGGYDPFGSGAGNHAGYGRWGLFMEYGSLTAGIPDQSVGYRQFEVARYRTDGTRDTLLSVGNNGATTVKVLTITGGADIAEPFDIAGGQIPEGSVVVIDEDHAGRLKLSTSAYDTHVAGIVSGANGINPGIALHQQGSLEGAQNVALTGRVYVQADATLAPIQAGDLLTTSDIPGHAMKASDHEKAQGAIIGKAMSTLKEGKGMVLVLITLQ